MAVLLIAEHDNATLRDATAKALTAARQIGSDVHVLVAGTTRGAAAKAAVARGREEGAPLRGRRLRNARSPSDVGPAGGQARAQLRHVVMAARLGRQEPRAARRSPARRCAGLRGHRGRVARHLRAADLCRQRHGDRADRRQDQDRHHPPHQLQGGPPAAARRRSSRSAAPARAGLPPMSAPSSPRASGRSSPAPRSSCRAAAAWQSGENFKMLEALADKLSAPARRQPRRGRRGLRAQRLPGRPDRQGGGARSLYRRRHLGCDPASRRRQGRQDHRRDQQGRGGADLPGGRLRPRGRSLPRPCRNWPANWASAATEPGFPGAR